MERQYGTARMADGQRGKKRTMIATKNNTTMSNVNLEWHVRHGYSTRRRNRFPEINASGDEVQWAHFPLF